jgi:AcrR family transcriptional regulator
MICEARNFPEIALYYHDTVIQRGKRLFTRTLERGIASGEFRPVDVEAAVHALLGPLLIKTLWRHSFTACGLGGAELDPERYLDTAVDLFLHGLRAAR